MSELHDAIKSDNTIHPLNRLMAWIGLHHAGHMKNAARALDVDYYRLLDLRAELPGWKSKRKFAKRCATTIAQIRKQTGIDLGDPKWTQTESEDNG